MYHFFNNFSYLLSFVAAVLFIIGVWNVKKSQTFSPAIGKLGALLMIIHSLISPIWGEIAIPQILNWQYSFGTSFESIMLVTRVGAIFLFIVLLSSVLFLTLFFYIVNKGLRSE